MRDTRHLLRQVTAIVLLAAGAAHASGVERTAGEHTPIVGLPCEGCDAALDGTPAQPSTIARLAPAGEPGEPLRLTGIVRDADRHPRSGVIVYAYQTDHAGIYPPLDTPGGAAARRHGRLRAWSAADADGRYTFLTIRPGGYPDADLPQHIHLHVVERGCATYYIDDVLFTDDPRLTAAVARELDVGRGGRGIVTPSRVDGTWLAQRDIVLGQAIPGHPGCAVAGQGSASP